MAALVNALDNYTPLQHGDNGHAEYGWSHTIQEKIAQFSFQVTRACPEGVCTLADVLRDLLTSLKHRDDTGSAPEKALAKEYLSVLYKLIGHTRDVVEGKGEYTLAYMMVHTWYAFYPSLAEFALKCFVRMPSKDVHPYGSWKDIKYFCEYCKSQNNAKPFIQYAVSLLNHQLKEDYALLSTNPRAISLAAKWAPREKSSFGWLYKDLATQYFADFMVTANTEERMRKAVLKCKTEYRKVLSALNRALDTTQIKQCARTWSDIQFGHVTSVTLSKQKKAFLNITKRGDDRCPENADRVACAQHFRAHIEKAVKGVVEMKGTRVGMESFTTQALSLLHTNSPAEKDLLNSQWRDNASQTRTLGKMLAMVDTSGSMSGGPLEAAIALGIRIAEKSVLGERLMTFSAAPKWIDLAPYPDFVSKVHAVSKAEWGMNTNFHAAMEMILSAIVQHKLSAEDVQDMVLVVLSDMQMDSGDCCDKNALYETMKTLYATAGIRAHGVPYTPPHILFWNLRSTDGFPTLSSQPNVSMMSGYSPALLNTFCEEGLRSLQFFTPWSLLVKSLQNERFRVMDERVFTTLNI